MSPNRTLPTLPLRTRFRTATLTLIIAGTATLLLAGAPAGVEADPSSLALGDSVVFGYITRAGFEYFNPDNFVAYPSYVGAAARFDTANAACPGEATSGFISSAGADNGCRAYRANFPLHVAYSSTQMEFATSFLLDHRQTRLVTIGLGANDLFLLQASCAPPNPNPAQCVADGLPQVLSTISSNMDAILGNLRATGFVGVLMVVNYYSLDYSDPAGTGVTELLNEAISASAAVHGAVVADVFTAFHDAASTLFAGGNTCRAGLLNASPQNQFECDVHPSQSGQQLIARTVQAAYQAALPAAAGGH